jgi:DNA-binding response OmpR family regulator
MSRRKILVVEDDDPIRELLFVRLDIAGYHVLTVCDGVEALERISSARPAAMVLDIGLPRLDGFAVLEALARHNLVLPTLVLTARNKADDVERALGLGAWDFLAKPFHDQVLVSRVARMLDSDIRRLEPCFI